MCSTAQTSLHAARSSSAVHDSGYLLHSHQAHLNGKALCIEEGARKRPSNNLTMYNCIGGKSMAKTVTCRALQDHERSPVMPGKSDSRCEACWRADALLTWLSSAELA